jgi:hypothetical protein
MTNIRTSTPNTAERGPVTLHKNKNGTMAVIGPIPRVVEMSWDLFMDWVEEINEHRRVCEVREKLDRVWGET